MRDESDVWMRIPPLHHSREEWTIWINLHRSLMTDRLRASLSFSPTPPSPPPPPPAQTSWMIRSDTWSHTMSPHPWMIHRISHTSPTDGPEHDLVPTESMMPRRIHRLILNLNLNLCLQNELKEYDLFVHSTPWPPPPLTEIPPLNFRLPPPEFSPHSTSRITSHLTLTWI